MVGGRERYIVERCVLKSGKYVGLGFVLGCEGTAGGVEGAVAEEDPGEQRKDEVGYEQDCES